MCTLYMYVHMVCCLSIYAATNVGFWMDIGQPKDFIVGVGLYLSFLHEKFPDKLEQGENFVGSVLVVSTCSAD